NNAGLTRDGLLVRMSDEDWRTVIDTNLSSVFYTCRAAARPMMRKRAGSIVNVSSIVGVHGNGGQTNYAASKAGVIGFTKSLAREPRGPHARGAGRGARRRVGPPQRARERRGPRLRHDAADRRPSAGGDRRDAREHTPRPARRSPGRRGGGGVPGVPC